MHLEAMRAGRPTTGNGLRGRPAGREAVAAGLIDEVPGKDGGVVFVQAPIAGIATMCHGPHMGLVHGSAFCIDEEGIRIAGIAGSLGPGCVLQPESERKSRNCKSVYTCIRHKAGRASRHQSVLVIMYQRFYLNSP